MANRDDALADLHAQLVNVTNRARHLGSDRAAVALDAAATAVHHDLDDATVANLVEYVTGGRPPDS